MPTATPFKTLGHGNGFIHSANGYSVDVNNYSVWTTLGGYNSDSTNSVTESQKICLNKELCNCIGICIP